MELLRSKFLSRYSYYLTMPVIKYFCSENNIFVNGERRPEYIEAIVEFANKSTDNMAKVLLWLDEKFKEGIKTLKVEKIYESFPISEKFIDEVVHLNYPEYSKENLVVASPTNDYKLVDYTIQKDSDVIKSISFTFLITLLTGYPSKEEEGETVTYPIFIDVDMQNKFIIGRAKSISTLFSYNGSLNFRDNQRLQFINIITELLNRIKILLKLEEEEPGKAALAFKKSVFKILESFSFTPKEIENRMEEYKSDIKTFWDKYVGTYKIEVNEEIEESAIYDLTTFVEKYLSITHSDPEIFIRDRDAYPYRICVVDNEYTKVDETSGLEMPIQCKQAFFDNKKTLFLNQKCDKLFLFFNRLTPKYFGKQPYKVIISSKKNFCIIDFPEYTCEEDITNVLSRVIGFYDV